MKTIYKYQIKIEASQEVVMTKSSEILTAQIQNDVVCIWAIVDPNEISTEKRNIEIFGTGQLIGEDLEPDLKYISTVQTNGTGYVWHIFESLQDI